MKNISKSNSILKLRRIKFPFFLKFNLLIFMIISVLFLLIISSNLEIQVEGILTDGYDTDVRLQKTDNFTFSSGYGSNPIKIYINENKKYQTIEGFGASITDSSAWLIHEFLTNEEYNILMDELFDPEIGIGISYIRLPMGSSDCALSWYTYDDTGPDLSDFSILHDEAYIIPLIKDALIRNPQLKIVASPFSAPGWMKSGNDLSRPETLGLIGGTLREDMFEIYSEYFIKFILAYHSQGIEIDAITLQNEPFYTPSDYPGMYLNEFQQRTLVKTLGPRLIQEGLATKILILDHNWNLADKVLAILGDKEALKYINGVAWHGYSTPNPEIQSYVHMFYPKISHYFTEVTGFNAAPYFHDNLAWLYKNIFIGSVKNWAKAALLWNLALNETGGPILRPYYDMRGVVTINQNTRVIQHEVEYYAIGQISKWVKPGAYRIDSFSRSSDIDFISFQNVDGSIVVVVSNPGSEPKSFNVCWRLNHISYTISPKSVITFRWS